MSDDGQPTDRDATLELMQRGVAALQAHDWVVLRSRCADDVTWHVPGRGPWGGTLKGIDAVMERWQRGAAVADAQQQAEVLAVMASEDMAVVVQRPGVAISSGEDVLTMLTLCAFRDRLIVRMHTYYSDQYAVDAFWESRTTAPDA